MDFSHNLLTFIPSNLLDSMKMLDYFTVEHNNLLHVDNLFSLRIPKKTHLQYNDMINVSSSFHIFSDKSIIDAKFKYTARDLPHCDGTNLYNHLNYAYVDTLDLSYNAIENLPKMFLRYYERICYWCLESKFGAYGIQISKLILTGNFIKSFHDSLRYIRIHSIAMNKNQIQYLTAEDFQFVLSTYNLELQENKIERIDRDAFKFLREELQNLDLSFNFIPSLNGSIRYMVDLRVVNLADNVIQSFAVDEFSGLSKLSQLSLQNNKVKVIGPLHQLVQLTLQNISMNDILKQTTNPESHALQILNLAGNPFKCDCSIQPFILAVNGSDVIKTDTDLCLKSHLSVDLQNTTSCPMPCSCRCTKEREMSFMLVDCSSKNLTVLPQFLINNSTTLDYNSTMSSEPQQSLFMRQNLYPLLHIEDRVLGINLENNNLESLETVQLPSNLIQLYLSNNELQLLPDFIFENQDLRDLTLSGNPWKCDCNAVKFKKWLTSKNYIIQDINDTRCGSIHKENSKLAGRVIWELTDIDLCPKANVQLIVIVSVAVPLLFVILCLAAKVLYDRYILNIKVFLYYHGFTFVKEEDLDVDKEFDAFVSFSNADGEFVAKEFIRVIENTYPHIGLCIHYLHFLPGEFIYDNIIRYIHNSKKTILILSNHFLDSEWCIFEFKTAHMKALQDKVHRVIVVKVGDLNGEIDPAIKAYLSSTTYLTWGETNFWRKLLYVLPSRNNTRNVSSTRDNEMDRFDCPSSEI